MIFDSLKNSALYYSLNPRLEKAFGFIASTDWVKMESGIHELDGKDIYVNVMDTELKKPADAKLEIHNAYLDIQVLVRGERETFGWRTCRPEQTAGRVRCREGYSALRRRAADLLHDPSRSVYDPHA